MAKAKKNYPSKITSPLSGNILRRDNLFDELDEARKKASIVWVSAPGGSGKTTLLSSYLQDRKLANIWYQIDSSDEDPATFFHYMALAAQKLAPRKKSNLPVFSAEYLESLPSFSQLFFEKLLDYFKDDGVLIFDNFQNIAETSPVVKLLKLIVDVLHNDITIIIVSRSRVPDNLIGLVANGALVEIGVDKIKFNKQEWLKVPLIAESGFDQDKLVKLHDHMDGWIAGLILCQYSDLELFKGWNGEDIVNESLFNYFAEEFFSRLDKVNQNLLIHCAFLHQFSEQSALAVSHEAQAGAILKRLLKKNYFIQKTGSNYILHPLFQSFLQSEAHKRLSDIDFKVLLLSSAQELEKLNAYELVANIYIKLETWDLLVKLIIEHAEKLYVQGRIATLQQWLNAVPKTKYEPWLQYWQATLQGLLDPAISQDKLEQVFDHFLENGDEKGAWTTWLKAMEQINSTWREVIRLKSWLNKYYICRERFPENLPFNTEAKIVAELAQGYMHSGHDPTRTRFWLDQLDGFISHCNDPELLTFLLNRGVFSSTVLGFMKNATRYLALIKESIKIDSLGPLLQMNILSLQMHNEAFAGDPQACLNLNEQTQALFKQYGVHFFEGVSQSSGLVSALSVGDSELAQKFYERLDEIKHLSPINLLSFCWGKTQFMSSKKRYEEAIEASKDFIDITQNTAPMPVFELIAKMTLIDGYKGLEQMDKVTDVLNELEIDSAKLEVPSVELRVVLMKAVFANQQKNENSVIKQLTKLFKLGQQHDMRFKSGWPPVDVISWACTTALKHNIEINYLNRYITSLGDYLIPPKADIVNWPWAIRIFTLGKFNYQLRGFDASFEGTKNNRPIQLLRLLVLNAKGINVTELAATMHPNLDEKKSLAQIRKHLHRLRALLGQEKAILREGDNLLLNKKSCWLDVDAFELLAKQDNPLSIEKALSLYQGEYLDNVESDDIKLLAYKEQLRSAYLRLALQKLQNLNDEEAINWCHDVLKIAPISELFYQKLMLIYQKNGQNDLARATYDQCRRTLQLELGVEPMEATTSIAKMDTPSN